MKTQRRIDREKQTKSMERYLPLIMSFKVLEHFKVPKKIVNIFCNCDKTNEGHKECIKRVIEKTPEEFYDHLDNRWVNNLAHAKNSYDELIRKGWAPLPAWF